jgi:type IV pilus assembly protein PilQ
MRHRWTGFLACLLTAGAAFAASGGGGAPSELKTFDYYSEAGETHLVFGASNPFFYTLYKSAPDTLTMEFPGLDASAFAKSAVQTGEVRAFQMEIKDGGSAQAKTKVTIGMAPGTTYSHWMQGTNLYVDLFGQAVSSETETATESEALAVAENEKAAAQTPAEIQQEEIPVPVETPVAAAKPAAPSVPIAPARRITGVRFEGGRVVIQGDGALMPAETFTLSSPERIVVDIKGVTAATKVLPVSGHELLQQVRLGQFRTTPDKVARVVLDLRRQDKFELRRQGDALEVYLGAAAPPPQTAAAETSMGNSQTPVSPAQIAEVAAAPAPTPAMPATAPKVETVKPQAEEIASLGGEAEAQWLGLDVTHFESAPGANAPSATQQYFENSTIAGEVKYTGAPISLDLKEADLKDVFRLFHELSGWNFVLDKSVGGRISIVLKDVPWDQALDIILKNEGLGKVFEGNVIFIAPNSKLTKEQADRRKLKDEQELADDPITVMRRLSYAKAQELTALVKAGKMLSKKGQMFQDKRTNTVFIQDVPQRVEVIDRLIEVLDVSTPQVEIEARIVETTKDYAKGLGIQWGTQIRADQQHGTATGWDFPNRVGVDYNVILPAGGAFSVLDMSLGNVLDSFTLDIQLTALERNGKGKILSSPRVVTLNNEKASIESGVQVPYVTTTDLQVNVQFQSATLKLDVTPQITNDETVILDVSVDKSEPGAPVTAAGVNIPSIITRKAKTNVLVRDGGTLVIGGVFQVSDSNSMQYVPKLGKIPGLGWLFRSKSITTRNDELLIFITPRIQRTQI